MFRNTNFFVGMQIFLHVNKMKVSSRFCSSRSGIGCVGGVMVVIVKSPVRIGEFFESDRNYNIAF